MNIKQRIKNKYFWVAAIALIVTVIKQFNPDIVPQDYEVTVNIILTCLVTMGILLDPTSPTLKDK